MKNLILLFFTIISSIACDSPMNNRVRQDSQVKEQTFVTHDFETLNLSAETRWLLGPFGDIKKTNSLLVFVYDASGTLTSLPENLDLAFYATMPSMGHPMDDSGSFEEIDTGIYINKTIRYNMGGDWKNELWVMDKDFNILDRLAWTEFF